LWVVFNAVMGFLMGVYHQGGIVPTQLAMRSIVENTIASPHSAVDVFWWKTYSPPLWLLGNKPSNASADITTHDLMGIPGLEMITRLDSAVPACSKPTSVFLVAPASATFLDPYAISPALRSPNLELLPLWLYRKHLNLDDLDFGDDGIVATLQRVIGRRGLRVWAARRVCSR
jgi:phosphatidylinositol glycan class Z